MPCASRVCVSTSPANDGLTRLQPFFHEAGPGFANLKTPNDAADQPHRKSERERNNLHPELGGVHSVDGAGFHVTHWEADGWEQNVKSHVGRKLNVGQHKSVGTERYV